MDWSEINIDLIVLFFFRITSNFGRVAHRGDKMHDICDKYLAQRYGNRICLTTFIIGDKSAHARGDFHRNVSWPELKQDAAFETFCPVRRKMSMFMERFFERQDREHGRL